MLGRNIVEFAEERETAADVSPSAASDNGPRAATLTEFGVVAALTEDVSFANVGGKHMGRYNPEN